MAVEIERRFLVIGDQWRQHCLWQARLRQGYLSRLQDGLTVRVRTSEALFAHPQPAANGQSGAASAAASRPVGSDGSEAAAAGAGAIQGNPGLRPAGAIQPQAWLTLKAPAPAADAAEPSDSLALSRLEFEYDIPLQDAQELLALTSYQVVKQRFGLDLPDGDWVLDVFEAANAPLVVAEVELESADQPVLLPPWCGRELTGLPQLSNAALALRPLDRWSQQERQELLGR